MGPLGREAQTKQKVVVVPSSWPTASSPGNKALVKFRSRACNSYTVSHTWCSKTSSTPEESLFGIEHPVHTLKHVKGNRHPYKCRCVPFPGPGLQVKSLRPSSSCEAPRSTGPHFHTPGARQPGAFVHSCFEIHELRLRTSGAHTQTKKGSNKKKKTKRCFGFLLLALGFKSQG